VGSRTGLDAVVKIKIPSHCRDSNPLQIYIYMKRSKNNNEERHNLHASPRDHIKDDGMGRTCSTHGRDEECIKYIEWKT
jgi:hypothetical protein